MTVTGAIAARIHGVWKRVHGAQTGAPGHDAPGSRPPRRARALPPLIPLAAVLAALVGFDAWLGTCGFAGCPSRAEVRAYRPDEGGRILDRSGRFIGRLALVHRVNVPLSRVPRHVQQAFIATEDRRFYAHHGIDWRGFARATVRDIVARSFRQGFSTIDMQVARNTFLANRYDGRSIRRKLLELRYARLLERDLTKHQILDLYLNAIYLGDGVYGVEAATCSACTCRNSRWRRARCSRHSPRGRRCTRRAMTKTAPSNAAISSSA